MCACCIILAAYWSRGPTAVFGMTLPICSTLPWFYYLLEYGCLQGGGIFGAKSWKCATYTASSKSLMVRSPPRLLSVRSRRLVEISTANLQTCHSQWGCGILRPSLLSIRMFPQSRRVHWGGSPKDVLGAPLATQFGAAIS